MDDFGSPYTYLGRDSSIFIVELAQKSQRFNDMAKLMKCVATTEEELSADEMKLLEIAYWKVIHFKKESWEILSRLEENEARKLLDLDYWSFFNCQEESREIMLELEKHEARKNALDIVQKYKKEAETQIANICNDILSIVDTHLTSSVETDDSVFYFTMIGDYNKVLAVDSADEVSVFYYTMRGDYNKFLAEIKTGIERKKYAKFAKKAYEAATSLSKQLSAGHPYRLSLNLRFAVFYRDMLNRYPKAWEIVDETIEIVEALPNPYACTDCESRETMNELRRTREILTKHLWDAA